MPENRLVSFKNPGNIETINPRSSGKAVEHGAHSLGYERVRNVRIGKFVELNVDTASREEAEKITKEVSEKLLANPVMEDFTYTIEKK